MSANSSEGPGLDSKWFGEEEENGMFGSAGPRFDEVRDDLSAKTWERDPTGQQFRSFEGSGVAMETASTGNAVVLFRIVHRDVFAVVKPGIKEDDGLKMKRPGHGCDSACTNTQCVQCNWFKLCGQTKHSTFDFALCCLKNYQK